MNVLILGSSGLLGRELYESLKSCQKIKVFNNGLKSRRFDINNKLNIKKLIFRSNPYLIINASGISNINYCEKKKNTHIKQMLKQSKIYLKLKKNLNLNFFLYNFLLINFITANKRNLI